jgi:hypothetical protein
LKLEDVLSGSIYKSNGTRTDLMDGQHYDEEARNPFSLSRLFQTILPFELLMVAVT